MKSSRSDFVTCRGKEKSKDKLKSKEKSKVEHGDQKPKKPKKSSSKKGNFGYVYDQKILQVTWDLVFRWGRQKEQK